MNKKKFRRSALMIAVSIYGFSIATFHIRTSELAARFSTGVEMSLLK